MNCCVIWPIVTEEKRQRLYRKKENRFMDQKGMLTSDCFTNTSFVTSSCNSRASVFRVMLYFYLFAVGFFFFFDYFFF